MAGQGAGGVMEGKPGRGGASESRAADLQQCNDNNLWRAEIMRQNWEEEAKSGYQSSKLSSQCTHRSLADGFVWSVSLKYSLSCGSMALIIDPQYEDFFSRGFLAHLARRVKRPV